MPPATMHQPAGPGARVVCLVPSITELICDLGLAGHLVGWTGFCIHPWETVRTIPKLGGTKDVNLDLFRLLGAIFGREAQAERLCAEFERAYASATEHVRVRRDVLYLI